MEPKKIDFHTWKIILACKRFSNIYDQSLDGISNKEVLSQYLKGYLCIEYMNEGVLYTHLLKAIFDVCDKERIYNIFDQKIPRAMYKNYMKTKLNLKVGLEVLNYSDLCDIFLQEFLLLSVRETVNGQTLDLYSILTEDGHVLTIDEANKEWIGKDKSSRPQKIIT